VSETVHLSTSPPASDDPLTILWKTAVESLMPNSKNTTKYNPHTTLGQIAPDSLSLLTDKATKLLERHAPFSWLVDRVAVLRKREDGGGAMEVYAELPIGPNTELVPREYLHPMPARSPPTYFFNSDTSAWISQSPSMTDTTLSSLTVATLNVLHDPSIDLTPRLSALVNALLSTSADILCLQEVTDTALPLLLESPPIRARWPWCSRAPDTVFESERNIILLAREGFAFEWKRVELGGGHHKACLVARLVRPLASSSSSIVLTGVHLSAGRTPTARDKRKAELDMLVSYLHTHHPADEWIVLGDVNWPASQGDFPHADVLADVWEGVDVKGATYDPTTNPLAAITAREGFRDPERYDRVYVKRGSRLCVQPGGFALFGFPGEDGVVGSDHWGISVDLQVVEMQSFQKGEEAKTPMFTFPFQLIKTSLTDDELHEVCTERGYIPSKSQDEVFRDVADVLRDFFTHVPSAHDDDNSPTDDDGNQTASSHLSVVRFIASPVGSFAFGCHTASSDIDCMVVGNVSAKTFWILVRRKIRASGNRGRVRLRRFVKDAQVQVMELAVSDVKVDLQYCPATNLVER
jgi:endonuclease/exonuclease/phosphatase family metal-dependent hydrolase